MVDYFTSLSSVSEELESMNQLLAVITVGEDVSQLLTFIHTQKEEAKLFQFLNRLDDIYTPQRSQMLMITPLPSVEMACAVIQQEESQKEVLKGAYSYDTDVSAMLSKTSVSAERSLSCSICGRKGHTRDKCWNIVGSPRWNYKHKPSPSNSRVSVPNARWNSSRVGASPKGPPAANVAMGSTPSDITQQPIVFSPQQVQQLLQLIPSQSLSHDYNEDALESPISGMITCNNVGIETGRWIMATGITDHMTTDYGLLHNVKNAKPHVTVNLPTRATTMVTHLGDVKLASGLKLLNVLYVPVFTLSENTSQLSFVASKATLADEYTLWHNRLGHATVSKLKFIECIKQCIHGVARVTWLYLLQHKSDYLKTMETFYHFVQRQFASSIKVIRSDNAKEFDDTKCRRFFQMQGIVHQTFCAYRSQQNARYFGCLAFAINPTYSSDKFASRGVPCVLGICYPPTQKGYRLLDLSTIQAFVSRDVTFNETIFSLNVTIPKPYMSPLPTVMPTATVHMHIDDDFFVELMSDAQTSSDNQVSAHETLSPMPSVSPSPIEATSNLSALEANDTWEIITLPPGAKATGYKWLYKT
ncbi:uncharacterized protein LOC141704045 [Apium graveolens]|uniref:uncharacterized protein LOC141704045 n=1 Tax=Apium graveolens TaxID=4045 RepID=UPI003D7B48CA